MAAVPEPTAAAPEGSARVPREFQRTLIDNLTAALLSASPPPCLLRSPTGSGKTFMLTRVLARVSAAQPVLWLWFVPYVNLVAQTVDAIDTDAAESGLKAESLAMALNEEPAAGLVLTSTVQGVASAKARKSGYTSSEDDARRSLAAYVARARAAGLKLGVVVDEAHIALDTTTEFGQFVHWLKAEFLLMATATPKDARLNEFVANAGYGAFETFNVARADVVAARLNKAWLQAVVYDLRQSMQGVTDLQATVLRRAWRRNQQIERELRARGLGTVPLMLVQVANGDEAIKLAYDFLLRELQIPAHAVALHSADEPDPVMMAAIANDTSRQVLVFKQSAGTGFDAPRAFVLASTKPVNDADFAHQFIGRVMRVAPEMQRLYPVATDVPPELDTAYVFLANAEAQSGFAQAAQAIQGMRSELAGQIEQLVVRPTALGGVALTNRPTAQVPLSWDLGLLATRAADGQVTPPEPPPVQPAGAFAEVPPGSTPSLFGACGDAAELDQPLPAEGAASEPGSSSRTPAAPARSRAAPATRDELFAALREAQIHPLPRRARVAARAVPDHFVTEVQPALQTLAMDVSAAATALPIDAALLANAVKAALNRMSEKEIRTELFTGSVTEEDVQVITDQAQLLERTQDVLGDLGLDEQDAVDVIQALSNRLLDAVEQAWALQDEGQRPPAQALRGQARQAACWVIHKRFAELQELLHAQWAERAAEQPAQPLPDALLLPATLTLEPSRKNIYGVHYPQPGAVASARETLPPDTRAWFRSETYVLAGSADVVGVACMDATFEFNAPERAFAQALDRADFVEWWHRNPQGKPYSVALLRGDSKNLFYPDFVVCLTHVPSEVPLLRLIDPKHDTKDAARKSLHTSRYYGKVLFLTRDANRFKIVEEDGSLGDVVDFDDLGRLKAWMRASQPVVQSEFTGA